MLSQGLLGQASLFSFLRNDRTDVDLFHPMPPLAIAYLIVFISKCLTKGNQKEAC